ncbi:nuclear envelope integral membrane protein 2 [Pelodytes ibericus]
MAVLNVVGGNYRSEEVVKKRTEAEAESGIRDFSLLLRKPRMEVRRNALKQRPRGSGSGGTDLVAADGQCIHASEVNTFNENQDHCLCYSLENKLKWYQLFSVVQLQINSTEALTFVQRPNSINCKDPENVVVFCKCLLQSIWKPTGSKVTYINVNQFNQSICFDVHVNNKPVLYDVNIIRTKFSFRHFILFFGGTFLFLFASKLSRSACFFCSAGITLGMTAAPIFLLLLFKRFISKHGTFWLLMSFSCFLTLYAVQFLMENVTWLLAEKKHFLFGYFGTAALLSFAACYRHGRLTDEWSISIFTWLLRLLACFLIYFGLTLPEVAYAVILVLFTSKALLYPFIVLCRICRVLKRKKPVVKLLTQEEYREQVDVETSMALEQLRTFCNSPDFNSWLVVSRLSSPKRFAEFILGSNHISTEEVTTHEEQYGLGSYFLEEQIFVQELDPEQNNQLNVVQNDVESNEENSDFQEDNYITEQYIQLL